MDEFLVYVRDFFRIYKSYNPEQLAVFEIILEAFNTFIEEILLAFHIYVGESDAINVQEVLFQDFLEAIRHIQPEDEDRVKSYLQRLQGSREERLRGLYQKIGLFRASTQVDERQLLARKLKYEEPYDLREFLILASTIVCGASMNATDSPLDECLRKIKAHQGTFSHKKELFEVDVINKRSLGKMIIRCIGHEGVDEKRALRRLLQACIDYLQKETEDVWQSALITIYDDDNNIVYKIASGTRQYKFLCRMKNEEPFIMRKFESESKNRKLPYRAIEEKGHVDPSENEGWGSKFMRMCKSVKEYGHKIKDGLANPESSA